MPPPQSCEISFTRIIGIAEFNTMHYQHYIKTQPSKHYFIVFIFLDRICMGCTVSRTIEWSKSEFINK